jgi:hypothetical protein
MIRLNLSINNSYNHIFKPIFCKEFLITKNKVFCVEFYKNGNYFFELVISTQYKGHDHAGPEFEIVLLGWTLDFKIYDIRHWDIENNTWINH